jgi:DNA repair protein RadC
MIRKTLPNRGVCVLSLFPEEESMDQGSPGVRERLVIGALDSAGATATEPADLQPLFGADTPLREPHHGHGHRTRLRHRLFEGGPDALLDHELVEYLLGLAIPRRDTKALAKRLLREFGSFAALMCADAATIARVGGISDGAAAALKIAQAAALRILRSGIEGRKLLGSWQALLDYLRADMAFEPVERVRVLFLNAKNVLIRDEKMWEGSVDESAVYIREIMRRALDLQATAIIVVHNHPSGDPTPSQQDIRLTRDLAEAGRHLRVTLHDHVIVGAHGHSSLRAMGVI